MLIRGSELSAKLQNEVKRAFVHRYTGEHSPEWIKLPRANGVPYLLQFKDDADWLASTFFWITAKGNLAKRPNSCESTPTWPNGKGE